MKSRYLFDVEHQLPYVWAGDLDTPYESEDPTGRIDHWNTEHGFPASRTELIDKLQDAEASAKFQVQGFAATPIGSLSDRLDKLTDFDDKEAAVADWAHRAINDYVAKASYDDLDDVAYEVYRECENATKKHDVYYAYGLTYGDNEHADIKHELEQAYDKARSQCPKDHVQAMAHYMPMGLLDPPSDNINYGNNLRYLREKAETEPYERQPYFSHITEESLGYQKEMQAKDPARDYDVPEASERIVDTSSIEVCEDNPYLDLDDYYNL